MNIKLKYGNVKKFDGLISLSVIFCSNMSRCKKEQQKLSVKEFESIYNLLKELNSLSNNVEELNSFIEKKISKLYSLEDLYEECAKISKDIELETEQLQMFFNCIPNTLYDEKIVSIDIQAFYFDKIGNKFEIAFDIWKIHSILFVTLELF